MQVLAFPHVEKLKVNTAVALGMFDGLHLGHKAVIQSAKDYAAENQIKTAVITLANHPRQLTQGAAPKLITNLDSRLALFEDLKIDYVLVLEFTEELMKTSAEEYLRRFLLGVLNARFISTGYNHHFGKNREGDVNYLSNWCSENQVILNVLSPYMLSGQLISSSLIRDLLTKGEMEKANQYLGHDYCLVGEVIRGKQLGQQLGFPTANLALDEKLQIPPPGVYCGRCKVGSEYFRCAINLGFKPTVDQAGKLNLEVHLLDFNRDIYREKIRVEFIKRIREEKQFASVDLLREQISRDIQLCF